MLQAYNAERAGAQAIIVMDNVQEGLLTMSNPEERPEIAKLKADVTIPTALVQKVRPLGAAPVTVMRSQADVCGEHHCNTLQTACSPRAHTMADRAPCRRMTAAKP